MSFEIDCYCGSDYSDAMRQQNFTVWCQARYNQKIFAVMGLYCDALRKTAGEHSAYFTNFVKVILPETHFKDESPVQKMLNQSFALRRIYADLLKREVEFLAQGGCRVFVTFGNAVSEYFRELIADSFDAQSSLNFGSTETFRPLGKRCYFVPERHYSYYSKKKTSSLISELQTMLNA